MIIFVFVVKELFWKILVMNYIILQARLDFLQLKKRWNLKLKMKMKFVAVFLIVTFTNFQQKLLFHSLATFTEVKTLDILLLQALSIVLSILAIVVFKTWLKIKRFKENILNKTLRPSFHVWLPYSSYISRISNTATTCFLNLKRYLINDDFDAN